MAYVTLGCRPARIYPDILREIRVGACQCTLSVRPIDKYTLTVGAHTLIINMSNLLGEVFIRDKARKELPPPHIGVGSTTDGEKQSLNPAQVQRAACELPTLLLGTYHLHRSRGIDEPNTWKSSLDQQVMTGDIRKLCHPQQRPNSRRSRKAPDLAIKRFPA